MTTLSLPDRIKALRLEARRINARAKAKARNAGGWSEMDAMDLADFRRYCEIQIEIERLKSACP